MAKKIVCFGGGAVVPKLIMTPLKDMGFDIVGITSMVDNGGSAGALRKEFNVLPPGDIRRHFLALAECEEWKKKLWGFRFGKNTELSPGHFGNNFANVFIGGLEYLLGDFEKALEIISQFLNIKGKALPATLDKVQIIIELEDGTIVEGEDEIDIGENHNRSLRVKRAFLQPEGVAYSKAVEEIKSADFITIGPGDMYSSIIPCFLSKGMKEAIAGSSAKKIFICPSMTKMGETQDLTVKDLCQIIENYIGTSLDFVIYNNYYPAQEKIDKFKRDQGGENKFLYKILKGDNNLNESKFMGENLIADEEVIEHDKEKLLTVLKRIIGA